MPEFAALEPVAVPRRAAHAAKPQVVAQATPGSGNAAQAQVHAARSGDLRITVIAPAKIGQEALTDPTIIGPQAGLAFQLGEHGQFRQDEYVVGDLGWTPAKGGAKNVMSSFNHAWQHDTAGSGTTQLPAPFTDAHLFSHKTNVPDKCAKAAAKQGGFDWFADAWRYEEHGKFVDTVEFAKRTIKRVYYFSYRADKQAGADMAGRVEYFNVDEVQRV